MRQLGWALLVIGRQQGFRTWRMRLKDVLFPMLKWTRSHAIPTHQRLVRILVELGSRLDFLNKLLISCNSTRRPESVWP